MQLFINTAFLCLPSHPHHFTVLILHMLARSRMCGWARPAHPHFFLSSSRNLSCKYYSHWNHVATLLLYRPTICSHPDYIPYCLVWLLHNVSQFGFHHCIQWVKILHTMRINNNKITCFYQYTGTIHWKQYLSYNGKRHYKR